MIAALEDGVRDQLATLARRLAGGMPRAGWKICVNDRRMQKRLGLDDSFVGFLDGSRMLASGASWKVEAGSILGVEPEFAIRFSRAVGAGDAGYRDTLLRAVEGVAPALEVVDWRDAKLELHAMAAGSSFHAGFAVGGLRPFGDVPAITDGCPRLERAQEGSTEREAEVLGVPDAALVPADLLVLVRHVAAFLARFGHRIEAGDWLMCGACTNPARVEAGQTISADFGRLGAVRVTFA